MTEQYPFQDETYRILGACFEVYNEMGCGFLEPVYQECLETELKAQRIPFASQPVLDLDYKGSRLQKKYQPDFSCFNSVLVEIKAVSRLTSEHRAQTLNYLNASSLQVGLLVNFGHYPKLEYVRIVNQGRGRLRPPFDESENAEVVSKHQLDEALEVDSS